jgi:hypothetical protein
MKKLLELHKKSVEKVKKLLSVSDYTMLWIAFGKGMILGAVLHSCL